MPIAKDWGPCSMPLLCMRPCAPWQDQLAASQRQSSYPASIIGQKVSTLESWEEGWRNAAKVTLCLWATGTDVERVRQRCITHRKTYQATGTKAAKRRLKMMPGLEAKFRRWVNHNVSKKLVAYAKDTKAVLVLEDLTHIHDWTTVRKGQRNKHRSWSFRQLRAFLAYKAQRAGVPVVYVDPRNTSRTCSKCGYVDKRNRRSQAEFSCLQCGQTLHADLNAARVLATRGAVSHPHLLAPRLGQLAFAW